MSLLKYVQRLERIHLLIRRGSTGNIDDFAHKMGLSRRQLLEELSDLKQLGAPIKFEGARQTYVYEFEWQPLASKIPNDTMKKFNGGGGGAHFVSQLPEFNLSLNLTKVNLLFAW
jgi:hypothetical protein